MLVNSGIVKYDGLLDAHASFDSHAGAYRHVRPDLRGREYSLNELMNERMN